MKPFSLNRIYSASLDHPTPCFCGMDKEGHLRCDHCGILAGPLHKEAKLRRVKAKWTTRRMTESGQGLFDLCESCQEVAAHGALLDPLRKVRASELKEA